MQTFPFPHPDQEMALLDSGGAAQLTRPRKRRSFQASVERMGDRLLPGSVVMLDVVPEGTTIYVYTVAEVEALPTAWSTTGGQQTQTPASERTVMPSLTGDTIYFLDKGDRGWDDWPPGAKADYLKDHPNAKVADGDDVCGALDRPGDYFELDSTQQFMDTLLGSVDAFGPVDNIVIGDHGNHQSGQGLGAHGENFADLSNDQLDQIANAIKPGGHLVLVGCDVGSGESGQRLQDMVQRNPWIKILASDGVTSTDTSRGNYLGHWKMIEYTD